MTDHELRKTLNLAPTNCTEAEEIEQWLREKYKEIVVIRRERAKDCFLVSSLVSLLIVIVLPAEPATLATIPFISYASWVASKQLLNHLFYNKRFSVMHRGIRFSLRGINQKSIKQALEKIGESSLAAKSTFLEILHNNSTRI
jgi:hypothetical protein